MESSEYSKMAEQEKDYWWHRGKWFLVRRMVEKYFPNNPTKLRILEIGCGTGEITSRLSAYGEVLGVDVSNEAIKICQSRGIPNVVFGDINSLDLSKHESMFDLILALDVLEHIQDDLETMRRVKYMLKPDGYFFVNVPAHKFLWSEHDEALHHKRRYHSLEIMGKLQDTGFKIMKKTFFVTTAFPAIVLFRMWNNFFGKSAYPKTSYVLLPKILNDIMTIILDIESYFATNFMLPIGTTITVVAKKSD